MDSIAQPSEARRLAVRVESLFHRMSLLEMACEAVEDARQRDALAGFVADAQDTLSGIISDLNGLKTSRSEAGEDVAQDELVEPAS